MSYSIFYFVVKYYLDLGQILNILHLYLAPQGLMLKERKKFVPDQDLLILAQHCLLALLCS